MMTLFELSHNVLVKPHKWQDPFENFIVKTENVYGQCWTLYRASDALWRIHSPQSSAVRVRSRAGKLISCLRAAVSDEDGSRAFVGRVRHLLQDQIRAFARGLNQKRKPFSNETVANALLIKKKAFEYEGEVRLLFFNEADAKSDLFSYGVNPHELVERIMIDPRMSQQCAKDLREWIRRSTGFQGEILHSRIYDPPAGTFRYSQDGVRVP